MGWDKKINGRNQKNQWGGSIDLGEKSIAPIDFYPVDFYPVDFYLRLVRQPYRASRPSNTACKSRRLSRSAMIGTF